jgi:DNA-sulfur modification-associated
MEAAETTAAASPLATIPEPTGYGSFDTYFATRYKQGGRWVYSLDFAIPELIALVPKPDPSKPATDNRRITPAHARKFAEYVIGRKDWVCPPMLLRIPEGEFAFEPIRTIGSTEFGILRVPKLARMSLHITDGQHRILGFHWAWERLDEEIEKARDHISRVKANYEDEPALVQGAKAQLKRWLDRRADLAVQRVGADVLVVDDSREYRQVFVDIADNALGISRSVSVRFDRRKVVNRALETVMAHPLLDGRVDLQTDRLNKNSPFLMGAKHVTDMIRAAQVGRGRIGKRLEDELNEITVAGNASRCLDALVAGFPDLQDLTNGKTDPAVLRARSLLCSTTMLRVLAMVYGELAVRADSEGPEFTHDEVVQYFESLSDQMDAPVKEGDRWMKTGLFLDGASAPSARGGDVNRLATILIDEARAQVRSMA